jgi:small subunit ribosomal protein S21
MPSVNVRDSEPVDVSIRRFKRACEKDNVLADIRRHEFYEKPKWIRKRLKMAAVKRHSKKLMRENVSKERGKSR